MWCDVYCDLMAHPGKLIYILFYLEIKSAASWKIEKHCMLIDLKTSFF